MPKKIPYIDFMILKLAVLFVLSFAIPYSGNAKVIYKKSVYSLPLSFDPIKMNDTASLLVSNLLYDGLLKFSPTMGIEGSLAESWNTSRDGKVLKFNLRKNIFFHNGKPITATDVVVSLKRLINPESIVRDYFETIEGSDTQNIGIRALDNKVVEIKFKKPFPGFLNLMAGATAKILPASEVNKPAFFKRPIGSGPFKLASISKDKLKLEIFDKYHNLNTNIEEMWLILSGEEKAISDALDDNLDDLANWPLSQNSEVFKKGKHFQAPVAATWIIGLNVRKSPLDSKEIRQRFKYDFPSDEFRKKFYPEAYQAFGYIPPGVPGHLTTATSFVPSKKISKESIRIVIPSELEKKKEMKEFIMNSMNSKGWNVVVDTIAWPELMKGYKDKEWQGFLVSMNMDYPDQNFLLRNFYSSNADNFSGLSNNKIDELLDQSQKEIDRSKRKELSDKVVSLIEEESVTINLFHPRAHYWVSKCIENFSANILSDVYIDYTQIKKVKGCL